MSETYVKRGSRAGKRMADAIMEFLHMMYNKQTAYRVLMALMDRLTERTGEFE